MCDFAFNPPAPPIPLTSCFRVKGCLYKNVCDVALKPSLCLCIVCVCASCLCVYLHRACVSALCVCICIVCVCVYLHCVCVPGIYTPPPPIPLTVFLSWIYSQAQEGIRSISMGRHAYFPITYYLLPINH